MNQFENNSNYLSAKEVSKILSIPLRTIQRLSKQGKIRAIRIGNNWKYKKSDVEQYSVYGTDFSKEPARRYFEYTEKRIYPRINCSMPCDIKISIPGEKAITTTCRILNISQGGVFAKNYSNDPLFNQISNDDPVTLSFELKENKLHTEGRVLRTKNNGLAIKFRDITDDTGNAIAKYVG